MKVLLMDQIAKVTYKYTFPLANALKSKGVDVTLVIDQKKEKENCNCKRVNLFNTDEKGVGKVDKIRNYIASYRAIEKMLSSGKYDVLHTQWYTFSPIDMHFIKKMKKKYKVKYVATVHDILPFNEKFYDRRCHKALYGMADKIIIQAPENMKRFAELFPDSKNRTTMIPLGHVLDYAEPVKQNEARKHLGIPDDKLVFLFFGQIKKVKGVDVLLKAIAKLKKEHPEFCFIIAGSVWKADFSECEKIIEENDLNGYVKTDIRFVPDEEIKYYYSASDVCVLPYTDVYQSGVVQLAYSYKKPVVASSLGAFTQFVKEGETGFLAKPGDVDDLKKALIRAAENKDKLVDIGQTGYELIKEKLSWDDIAKKITENCY